MIDNPARRAHDHLCALGKRPKLPLNGLPAVNRQNRNAPFVYGQFAQFFGYLNGQLAGRAKHQRLHALAGSDLFQNGQAERRRFAGSGLGEGSSNPKSSTAFKSSWDSPSSVNDAVMMFL